MTPTHDALPKLTAQHDCSEFRSGADELDDWLRTDALKSQMVGNATTFVVAENDQVFGYYALAPGGVERATAPGPVRRNAPQPIPILLLARLAVDQRAQRRGVGRRLIQDALLRALHVSASVGFRAVLVHCRDDAARDFYVHHVPAFIASPADDLHLLLPLTRLRETLVEDERRERRC